MTDKEKQLYERTHLCIRGGKAAGSLLDCLHCRTQPKPEDKEKMLEELLSDIKVSMRQCLKYRSEGVPKHIIDLLAQAALEVFEVFEKYIKGK